MFRFILLDCLIRMNAERTVSGIYHLLRGKKSSQTFQDAMVYGIDGYYGIYPELKRETLLLVLKEMHKEHYIEKVEENRVRVTGKGRAEWKNGTVDLYFFGMEYSKAVDEFQERLLLWIQVVSNHLYHHHSYIPVIDKPLVQQWAKVLYNEHKHHIDEIGSMLQRELRDVLSNFSEPENNIFIRRFTGGDGTGWTYAQLAEAERIEVWDVPLFLKNSTYYLFSIVSKDTSYHLHQLTKDLVKKETLTLSAKKSIELFDRRKSLEEVALIRGLKKSTVEDHFVEAVLVNPGRAVDPFIREEEYEEVRQTVQLLDTKKLKRIYEHLEGRYTYFQLRIVLAKLQKG